MKKYSGTYICPHCEEKFSWEYIDTGYRRGMGEFFSSPYTQSENPSIAQCKMEMSRVGEYKTLICYCTHCQMPVELTDIDSIPKELFS